MSQNFENPLVTIIVITYNSSKYIIETLESARKQTYPNIELVISDDSSKDDTVSICREWLKNNSQFFKASAIIVNEINKGVAGNCNSGFNKSSGEWVKIIAGDDLLLENSIENYIDFAQKNKFNLFFAYPKILLEVPREKLRKEREEFYESTGDFFNLSAKNQFYRLLISDILPMNPATIFFNAKFVRELGGFDEKFMPEDLPLYLKATSLGHKLGIMKKKSVLYRIHNSSLTFKGKGEGFINIYWFEVKKKIKSPYITQKLIFERPLIVWEYYNVILWKKLTLIMGNNKKVWKILRVVRLTSPLYVLNKIETQFGNKKRFNIF